MAENQKGIQMTLADYFADTESFDLQQAQELKAISLDGSAIPVYHYPKDASVLTQEINAFFERHPNPEAVEPLKSFIAESGNSEEAFYNRTLHQMITYTADTKMLDVLYNFYAPLDDKYMLREIACNPRSSEDIRMKFNSLALARNDPARPRPALSSLIQSAENRSASQQSHHSVPMKGPER